MISSGYMTLQMDVGFSRLKNKCIFVLMNVEGCTDSCPSGCHFTIRFVKCVLYESSGMRILHCLLYTLMFSVLLYAKSAVHKYLDKYGV